MATGKITKSAVERLVGGWIWDSEVKGFGVRRQLDGAFYYLRYRLGGRQCMKSIGRHGSPWTPDTARRAAQEALGEVVKGKHPAFATKPAGDTFGAVLPRFLERQRLKLRPRAFEEVERHLVNHSAPLAKLRLSEIDRRTVAKLLEQIERDRGPVARNRVRSSLSAFFEWAFREGLVEVNPVQGTDKAHETERTRVLSDTELAELWQGLDVSGIGDFGDIVRLLLLTGQRRDEIGGLCWSEVDLAKGVIHLAADRTKNKRPHEVPLSAPARAILERRSVTGRTRAHPTPDGDWVFGIRGFSGWSWPKAALDKRLGAKVEPWTLHDLRRSCATGMAELGVPPHIIEAVLNHVSGHKAGVAGIYNRARYESEMRDALARWAAHVEALARPGHDMLADVPALSAKSTGEGSAAR
jgi:integrase